MSDNGRHTGDVFEALDAIREECALEALVGSLGDSQAQHAAQAHALPVLVAALQLDTPPRTATVQIGEYLS